MSRVQRLALTGVAAAAVGALAAAGTVALGGHAPPPGVERTITEGGKRVVVREVAARWRLVDVGARGRTLKLLYQGGGCLRHDGRALVHESRWAVEIEVRQGRTIDVERPPGTEFACTSDLSFHTVRVPLARPIGGRSVEGGPPIRFDDDTLWSRTREKRAAACSCSCRA